MFYPAVIWPKYTSRSRIGQVNPSWGAPPVDCDDERPSPRPVKGCVTNEVACGDVIEGTTIGGVNTFGDTFYQQV